MRTLPYVFYSLLTMIHFCTGYDEWYPCRGCEASHAVEGAHSRCVNTEDGFPMTWHVDLQEVKSITKISIFYNTSGILGKVHNYEVYLSHTTRWQNGFLCIEDAGPSRAIIGLEGNCQVFARYIIFHNAAFGSTNSAFSPVCEVIVKGCEQSGTYGLDCDKHCPENCRDNRCRIEGGDCYSCKDGWTGNKCQKKAVRPLEDTGSSPLAVIVGVSVPVSILMVIIVTVICIRRCRLGCKEKPQVQAVKLKPIHRQGRGMTGINMRH